MDYREVGTHPVFNISSERFTRFTVSFVLLKIRSCKVLIQSNTMRVIMK